MPELLSEDMSPRTVEEQILDIPNVEREMSAVEQERLTAEILRWESNFTLMGIARGFNIPLRKVEERYEEIKNLRV